MWERRVLNHTGLFTSLEQGVPGRDDTDNGGDKTRVSGHLSETGVTRCSRWLASRLQSV